MVQLLNTYPNFVPSLWHGATITDPLLTLYEECTADKLVNMIPDVLKKVKGVFKKDKSESADDFSEITQDDIDG